MHFLYYLKTHFSDMASIKTRSKVLIRLHDWQREGHEPYGPAIKSLAKTTINSFTVTHHAKKTELK